MHRDYLYDLDLPKQIPVHIKYPPLVDCNDDYRKLDGYNSFYLEGPGDTLLLYNPNITVNEITIILIDYKNKHCIPVGKIMNIP